MKLTYECSPNLLKFFIREYARCNQETLAEHFDVTPAAISKAINSDPSLESLRRKIIDFVKSKQLKAA